MDVKRTIQILVKFVLMCIPTHTQHSCPRTHTHTPNTRAHAHTFLYHGDQLPAFFFKYDPSPGVRLLLVIFSVGEKELLTQMQAACMASGVPRNPQQSDSMHCW